LFACFSPLRFKVLLALENLPTHAWTLDMVQAVIGSSSLVFEPTPASVSRVDRSHFYVVAWAVHPDLISAEVSGVLPKPKVPFVEGEPPLFPWASKIIH
jgi:hypothetical protein